MPGPTPYRSVVFAGGGSRCFWQAGFWRAYDPDLSRKPEVVAATSAGASTACHVFGGVTGDCLEFYRQAGRGQSQNFHFERLLRRGEVYPGRHVYRGALATVLKGAGMARLREGPEIRVLMAMPPRWAPGGLGTLVGYLSYELEKRVLNPVHPQWGLRLGFRPLMGRADLCADSDQLADLVLAASCLPPLVPAMTWQGRPVLDGGFIDNVPLLTLGPGEGPTLVLLTRRYPRERLQGRPGVTYVQPSRRLGISKFEYVDMDLIQATYDLGLADGERFRREGPEAL